MTDSQPSDTPKNLEELSQAIDHLEKNLDSISRSQRSGRTTVLIGSLLLLAMIGIFGINLFQTLKTQISKFGSKCEISDKVIEKISKMGVMESAILLNEVKANKAAKKATC